MGKENSLPVYGEGRLCAFQGALSFSEPAGPISRKESDANETELFSSGCAVFSICTVSHGTHGNGLPCEQRSSACVFFFLRDDSSQVKGHSSSDKTFLLLFEFCVCFLAKPTAA